MGTCNSVPENQPELIGKRHPHEHFQFYDVELQENFGWIPDLPDHRDLHVQFAKKEAPSSIKKKSEGAKEIVDLRPQNGGFPIFNQGHLGSCTANALAAAFHFTLHKQNVENHADFTDFTPSRLFIYYNERYVENSVDRDAGAMIRDGIKVMEKMGVCPEKIWKYDDGPDFFKQQPDKQSYELAGKCKVKGYAKVAQDLDQLKNCIKHGYPFVFGFTVLTSFSEAAKDGTMVMPQQGDRARGGHAVTGVGYDDFRQCFIVRNSWGESWGDKGYFYMPYTLSSPSWHRTFGPSTGWKDSRMLCPRRSEMLSSVKALPPCLLSGGRSQCWHMLHDFLFSSTSCRIGLHFSIQLMIHMDSWGLVENSQAHLPTET